MSITGFSFSFRRRQQTLDDLSERLFLSKISSRHIGPNSGQSSNNQLQQFSPEEQSRLKRLLPTRARLHLTHYSPVASNADPHSSALIERSQSETNSQNARPPSSRSRSNNEIHKPNDMARLTSAGERRHQQAGARKPGILVIHSRAFFRDCFVRCLEISYKSHDILAFATISEWRNSPEQNGSAPSVIIFFIDGANEASLTDLQFLESAAADTPVVIMSDVDDVNCVMRALKGGARGYIPTSLPFNVAVEAVRLVEAGGTFVPVSSLEFDRDTHEAASRTNDILTERQMMVVEALCQGMANKQIAYELGMSEHTVKVHLRHIMRKLKVRNRTEVAVLTKDFFDKTNEQRWPDSAHKDVLPS